MYDEYAAAASSSSSSTRSSILRASIPHLHSSPLSAHAHAYGHRASKASDIAHLLDPSYSPPRGAGAQIYVDHAGEAHDPDYRLFAVVPARSTFSKPTSSSRYDDDDDDDDVIDEGVSLYSRRASFDSSRDSASPTYDHHAPFSYDAYAYTSSEPAWDDAAAEPRRESNKLRRRRASYDDADDARPALDTPAAPASDAPTRRQILRRQWHALCLRTQVAAFRARRRVEHAVSPKAG